MGAVTGAVTGADTGAFTGERGARTDVPFHGAGRRGRLAAPARRRAAAAPHAAVALQRARGAAGHARRGGRASAPRPAPGPAPRARGGALTCRRAMTSPDPADMTSTELVCERPSVGELARPSDRLWGVHTGWVGPRSEILLLAGGEEGGSQGRRMR